MKIKKYLACLLAAMMMCGAAVACGGSSSSSTADKSSSAAADDSATEAEDDSSDDADESSDDADDSSEDADDSSDAADDSKDDGEEVGGDDGEEVVGNNAEIEEANSAEPGQAYLAIVDDQWWIQYWGSATDEGYMLAYDAGIADITGNGEYTVSVTADTNGFRLDTTQDANDQYVPTGLNFLAVMIPDGENLYPGIVLTIDSIVVDGKEIELTAKNYTSSDDGVETRTNIYNQWVSAPSADGRSVDGALYDEDGNANDICADYSAQIVDLADFSSWTTVEVNFTVSGLDE